MKATLRTLAKSIDERLTAPGPDYILVWVRTGLALALGFRLASRWWAHAADNPAALYDPPFAVSWLPSIPPGPVLAAIQVVGLIGATASVARRAPRIGLAVAWCALVVLGGLWGSDGKVLHNDVLLLCATIPLLAAHDPSHSYSQSSVGSGWPPRAALAVVGTIYLVAGGQKLRHSGLDWVTSDNFAWILRSGAAGRRAPFPTFTRAVAESGWLTHVLAAGALATELAAPILLWFSKTRVVFLAMATALHLGTWATLGLDYATWPLSVAAVAIPYTPAYRRISSTSDITT